MAIGKDFTFTKNLEKGRLHTPKVCKVAKDYKGACEHCSSDIVKGTFVLCAEEVVSCSNGFGVRTVKTHRLCASCTADYIKATSVQTPEPTYAERQALWVKENNVKEGTKVRVTRTFTADEDGSCCWKHDDLVGMTGTVAEYGIASLNLGITMSDGYLKAIPYFALEVVKEPTYRPYNNDELNDLVGEVLTNKQSGRKKIVTGKPTASEGVNLDGSYISAKDLLASFYRNTDKPCGVREQA